MADIRAEQGRRTVGVFVLALIAVVAAIIFMGRLAHRPAGRAPATPPVAMAEPPVAPATPPPAETEQPSAPAQAAAPAISAQAEAPAVSARRQSEIARVVTDGQAGLRICYERALLRDQTLVNANLNVRVAVAPSGRVDRVSVTGPAEFRAALRPCLDAAVSRWTFPASPTPYEAKFPLALRAAQ